MVPFRKVGYKKFPVERKLGNHERTILTLLKRPPEVFVGKMSGIKMYFIMPVVF